MMSSLTSLSHGVDLKRWLLQAIFIIGAVLLSVITITWILEKSLVRQALELEAEAFIEAYRQDPQFPLPRTRNLTGYLVPVDSTRDLPKVLRNATTGLFPAVALPDREKAVPVYITDFDDKRLVLVFDGANVDRLVGIFGLVPLTVLLILIYTSSWIAYRISWRAVSPIIRIAQNIRESDPETPALKLPLKTFTGEARELAIALDDYVQRIDAFVERERQFTADVSHELRTPMCIIDGAAQFLAAENGISVKGGQRVQMIRRACKDVNELIAAFLLLARERAELTNHIINVADVVESEIIKLHSQIESEDIKLKVNIQHDLTSHTPGKVLEIIIGNLCRNAFKYTERGEITVTVAEAGIMISDTGQAIAEDFLPYIFQRHVRGRGHQEAGEGIGLAIVKRLCDQFSWHINITNKPEGGVLVCLTPQ